MKTIRLMLISMLVVLMTSCLTVEYKKYVFEFTGKNSGKLTITYYNIHSQKDDTLDVSAQDFEELINDYLTGNKIESYFPLATNFKKRLFVENNQLCGEITMEFNSLEAARLMQLGKKGPIVMDLSKTIDGESFESTNGTYGNSEYMNIVYWPANAKKLEVVTSVSKFDPERCVSLAAQYYKWK